MTLLENMRISRRLLLIVAISLAGLFGLSSALIYEERLAMIESQIQKTRDLDEAAQGIATGLHQQAQAGLITDQQAKERFHSAIHGMRFEGGSNYMFAFLGSGETMVHPGNPALEGKNLLDLKDSDGVFVIREIIKQATSNSMDPVWYQWPRAGSDVPEAKVAFARYFEPWDVSIGTGIYLDDVEAVFMEQVTLALITIMGIAAGVICVSLIINRSIVGPIGHLQSSITQITQGDLSVNIIYQDNKSEIGDFARAFSNFQSKAQEAEALRSQVKAQDIENEKSKQKERESLADNLEKDIGSVSTTVFDLSNDMSRGATEMLNLSHETKEQAAKVEKLTNQSFTYIENVAAAVNELASSISEISDRTSEASDRSSFAATEAEKTSETVQTLEESAKQIGDVIAMISQIADQTNLLALNATIEAARAGDAGKGFAVVASEVKNLASQTALATQEIHTKISNIQDTTSHAVAAITNIHSVIKDVASLGTTVASAVVQQDAATKEIGRSVEEVSKGTQLVAEEIGNMTESASKAQESSTSVSELCQEVNDTVGQLSQRAGEFADSIRGTTPDTQTEEQLKIAAE